MFTVGHGARPIEQFVAVLLDAGVSVVVDIRRFPGSRRHPQFGREPLAAAVGGHGIGYEWQGEALGGRRAGRPTSRHTALRNPSFRAYADHMDGEVCRTALNDLLARTATERPALLCAETLWWHCHRMLVADALAMLGASVVHLIDVGSRQPHRVSPAARQAPDGWPVYDVIQPLPGL
jgi:uncharacterized protein (DUF488 family)